MNKHGMKDLCPPPHDVGAGISVSFHRFHGQIYFSFGTNVVEKESEIH